MSNTSAYALLALVTAGAYPAVLLVCCTGYLLVQIHVTDTGTPELFVTAIAALIVGLIGIAAIVRGASVVSGTWIQTRRLRIWIRAHSVPLWPEVENALAELDGPRRVIAVDATERMALTIGFIRPTIVFSTGLYDALPARQFRSVLAHEVAHARKRHPLRLFAIRVLTAHLWFLPGVRTIRDRIECSYELAADWHAASRYGSSAVAGALLSLVHPPSGPSVGAAFYRRNHLADRVAQLECGHATHLEGLAATNETVGTVVCAAGFTIVSSLVLMFTNLLCTGCTEAVLSWI